MLKELRRRMIPNATRIMQIEDELRIQEYFVTPEEVTVDGDGYINPGTA